MFITFEGSEGSGKSTQIDLLAEFLSERGFQVVRTREPGGTQIGEQLRQCLHDVANRRMTAVSEALLYSASRAQLVEEIIRPALENRQIVLSDRYADSTLAYQGYGRRLDLRLLAEITRFATSGLRPDMTFFLDLEVRQGLNRRTDAGKEMNRMDLQTVAFYERVRSGYLELAADDPERWLVVNANRPVEVVQSDLRQHVAQRLDLGR